MLAPMPFPRARPFTGFPPFLIVFFGFWYWTLFQGLTAGGASLIDGLKEEPTLILFLLALLLLLEGRLRMLRKPRVHRPTVEIDGTTHRLLIDDKPPSDQPYVVSVQARSFPLGEATEYRMSVLLGDGTKVRLAQGTDAEAVFDLAERVADHVGVEIVKK